MRVMRPAYPDPHSRPEPLFRRKLASTATATAHSLAPPAASVSTAASQSCSPALHQSSQLPPATPHSPAPPAASAPLDSLIDSTASVPCNTLPPPAASTESRASSAALRGCMASTQGGYTQQVRSCLPDESWDNAVPPREEVNTKMYEKDAENNLLAGKNLSPCKKDPGDVYARCSLARYVPQPPGLTSLLVSEVKPAPLVVRWRGITGKRHQSPCASARYNPHLPSGPRGITREVRPTPPLLIPSHCRTIGSRTSTTTSTPQSLFQATQLQQAPPYGDRMPSNSMHFAGAARKRSITRTFYRCLSRAAPKQTPPHGITCTPSPRAALTVARAASTSYPCGSGSIIAHKRVWG